MQFNFNLTNSHAVALGKGLWRENIIKRGGSDVTKVSEVQGEVGRYDTGDSGTVAGIAYRVFDPWLADVSLADRERIADIIVSSIETGHHPKDVAKELKKIPALSGLNTRQIAEREIKYLMVAGTMKRFESENVQQGIWHTLDPKEKDHIGLNGKEFDLDDPIWNLLYQDGCKCYCEPVLGI